MGLDWNPANKPKDGFEAEYWKLFDELSQESASGTEVKVERLHEISISAFDTLKTPQVGLDPRANEWAAQVYHAEKREVGLDQWLHDLEGLYVLDLVEDCFGLPRYSNGTTGGYVERFSFRAQFLADCEYFIGDLFTAGYEHKKPAELREYGNALLAAAEEQAAKLGVKLSRIEDPEDPDSPEFHLDVVRAAGRWCLFWAERGHPMEAYW